MSSSNTSFSRTTWDVNTTSWDQKSTLWDSFYTPEPDDPTYWADVITILKVFFPQYFNPESPSYVDPITLGALLLISDEARPWCLSTSRQNLAQAMFLAYLISVQQETSSGQKINTVSGPVTMEREGDIAVTYADASKSGGTVSKRPSSDPWDAWNRLWTICSRGAITTRYGDPCQPVKSSTQTMGGKELSATLVNSMATKLR